MLPRDQVETRVICSIKIIMRALEEPLRMIAQNAGDEPSVVVNKVVEGKGNFGYNAATGEYGDMVELGVLDPTKVTRYALQNAASVASLMLTTDAMVAEAPTIPVESTSCVIRMAATRRVEPS